MSLNRKVGPLKELQGLLWKSGYESGMLKGIVYDDVVVALQSWKRLGIKVHVYSSGSIAAQKLLFGYSNQGSLLEYFEHHFDTNIGSKLESSSYTKISNEIKVSPADALFLSDNINECLRAREAGFQVVNVNRPGNAAIPDLFGIKQIDSFAKLFE